MIICFSGTGNTRRMADRLQDMLGDELLRFPPGLMNYPQKINQEIPDDRIIWMFPIHSWGLPDRVAAIIKNANLIFSGDVVHHMVCTCGDDIGYADKMWREEIEKRGWKSGCTFSITMPNSYTFLPGFDVDSQEMAQRKLEDADKRIAQIADAILDEKNTVDVVRGSWPWIKTKVLYPFYRKFLMSTTPFNVDAKCASCGRCSRNCPLVNIKMVNGRPQWGPKCTMCLRCYHCCPTHAVNYGTFTKNKGQYLCPGYVLKD